MKYKNHQFVIAQYDDGEKTTEELGTVASLNVFGDYEVLLLSRHKPGEGFDMVFMFGESELASATREQIEEHRARWEELHNHKLPFGVAELSEGLFIGPATPAPVS